MSLVDLGKRLLDAAKRGETDEVRQLMSNGAPFTTDWLGTSPLHFSAQYGHVSTAEVLLRAGISRDARTKVDRTPLHVAAQEGHVAIVDLLLQHAADIDAKDMLKMTPLHWATEKGHMGVIETLLKANADVQCENKFDRTPLDIAIINGRPDIVQTLQLAQHTAVGNLQPTETVTIETSQIDVNTEGAIIDGSEGISMEEHTIVSDTDEGNILLQNMQQIKTETVVRHFKSKIYVNTEGAIIDGSEGISMEEHTIVSDTDEGNILLQNMQQIKTEAVDDVTEDEGNSTSVLATLAALAEATAQNSTANSNTTDAINWLESQGITMISTADGNIITSAVESGQTISLTAPKIGENHRWQSEVNSFGPRLIFGPEKVKEGKMISLEPSLEAGKIALNIIKQQGLATEDGVLSNVVEEGEEDKDESQKVITYVTTDGGEIHQDTEGLHITSVATIGGEEAGDMVIHPLTEIVEEDEPEVKRARLTDDDDVAEVSTVIDVDSMLQKTGSGDATTLDNSDVEEIEREKLRKELEDFKRQAEEFKEQLKQKDRDLEEYKKQLGEISDKSDDLKDS